MKFILVSDLHLILTSPASRTDNLEKEQWNKLEKVYRYARKVGGIVLQAGDFVDSPRSWMLLKKIYLFFRKFPDVKTYFVIGQHDLYIRSKTSFTIVSVLTKLFKKNFFLLTKNSIQVGNISLFGVSYNDKIRPIKTSPKSFNILLIHKPITMDLEKLQNYSSAKSLIKQIGTFNCVVCGDIHKRFIYINKKTKNIILNSGPLIRKSQTDIDSPGFFVLDTETKKCIFKRVSKVKDPFFRSSKTLHSTEYLNDFITNVKKETNRLSYLNLSSEKKVLLLSKKLKSKRIKSLICNIMNLE